MKLAFIGAGKMAEAIIARLENFQIIASDINQQRLGELSRRYKISRAADNQQALAVAEVAILAVKPQNFPGLVSELAKVSPKKSKLIISIAAGIPLAYLQKKLPGYPIIRAMPNNPCLIGEGMTALAIGRGVGKKQAALAAKIFHSVGQVVRVPEKWLDAVTGLSGSGPAFVYLLIEALVAGGKKAGLPEKVAEKLALQTVLGAAKTVLETGLSPRKLREMVTSPGGTTVEGLAVMEKYLTAKALSEAVRAAARKSAWLRRRWSR